MELASGIQRVGAGRKIKRTTLLQHLGKSASSSASRDLITNSAKYGITTGNHGAEYLDLTPDGAVATSADASLAQRLQAQFNLAILHVEPFSQLYEEYKENKLPSPTVMKDFLIDAGLHESHVGECVDTFLVNAKFLGLLRGEGGAERLLSIQEALSEIGRGGQADGGTAREVVVTLAGVPRATPRQNGEPNWERTCFYISPIGDPDSEERSHADMFLESIVVRAIEQEGLTVVRADHIGAAGMITRQVIEHIVKSKLVIADLSFHNPNVFYELAVRHMCRLPTVQIIRSRERIPFDLDQVRTVIIDTDNMYALVRQLDVYRSEIATQVRHALADPDAVDSPISLYYPGLRTIIP